MGQIDLYFEMNIMQEDGKQTYGYQLNDYKNRSVVKSVIGYKNQTSCMNALINLQTVAANAPVEDRTSEDYYVKSNPKYVIVKESETSYYFYLTAMNGQIKLVSSKFATRADLNPSLVLCRECMKPKGNIIYGEWKKGKILPIDPSIMSYLYSLDGVGIKQNPDGSLKKVKDNISGVTHFVPDEEESLNFKQWAHEDNPLYNDKKVRDNLFYTLFDLK